VVDNQVDPTTGTVKLKANFPNDKLALWPGAFINARLLVETLKGVTVIPTAAVQRGPNGTFVYIIKQDQSVAMKPVKVRQQDDSLAVIADGVAAGDKVVTTGFARLQDGSKVQISAGTAPDATTPDTNGQPVAANPTQADGNAANDGQRPHRQHNGQGDGNGSHRKQNADGGNGANPAPNADGGAAASTNSTATPAPQQ
jgi:multidrug efflux system membrane fusion protein